jgi:hypothetical protein
VTAAIPSATTTSDPGIAGASRREHDHERADADQQRQALGLAEVADQISELLKEVAGAFRDTEQFRQLTDDDRQRQSDDESLHDRLGDEARQEPESQDAGDHCRQSGADRQRRGHRDEPVAAGRRIRGHGGRRQRRSR